MLQHEDRWDQTHQRGLLVVGAGPAGLAPFFAAASVGRLSELLDLGVTLVERSDQVGSGALANYAIASDSTASAFLDVIKGTGHSELRALASHPAARSLARLGNAEAPLALVAEWLAAAGGALCEMVRHSRHGRVLTNVEATSVRRTADEAGWLTHIRHRGTGLTEAMRSARVLLTTGAHQPVQRLQQEHVAGIPLFPRHGSKLLQSGVVLARGGREIIASRLRGIARPRVVIVGGSTSAAATAVLLLQRMPEINFESGSLILLHRQPIRICYESVDEAVQAGDKHFGPEDVCPLTRRVNRFSGLRLSSRELMMRAQALGSEPAEPRLRLVNLSTTSSEEIHASLESADLVIAALGYRPLLLPVLDARGGPLALYSPTPEDWSAVDRQFRVRKRDGSGLSGLLASGLAVGPSPDRALGGELGFRGQVNSLWMWQHNLGLRLFEELVVPVQQSHRSELFNPRYMSMAEPLVQAAAAGGAR